MVELPLAALGAAAPISSIRLSGNLRGSYFLDDMRLVSAAPQIPAPTAVFEQRTGTVPLALELAQNYPNPCNAGTVIGFALPQRQPVELVVYNASGQQVATLIRGVRPAGRYAVRWEGRRNGGEALGSGLYLYQLRAGNQAESRKLLLR